MDKGKLKELVEFQVNRNVINLYKTFLIMMEDMHQQHQITFTKLRMALPEDESLINQADYWDPERMDYLRKKILDTGNNTLREVISQLDQFELTIK